MKALAVGPLLCPHVHFGSSWVFIVTLLVYTEGGDKYHVAGCHTIQNSNTLEYPRELLEDTEDVFLSRTDAFPVDKEKCVSPDQIPSKYKENFMFNQVSLYRIGTALIFVLVSLTFGIQFSHAHSSFGPGFDDDVPEPHHHHDSPKNEVGHDHGLYEVHTHNNGDEESYPVVTRRVSVTAETGTHIGAPVTRGIAVPLSHGSGKKHTLSNVGGYPDAAHLFEVIATTGQLVTKHRHPLDPLPAGGYQVFVDVLPIDPANNNGENNAWNSIIVLITVDKKYAPKFVERPIVTGNQFVPSDQVRRWVGRGARRDTNIGDPLFAAPYENLTYSLDTQTNRRTDDDRVFEIDNKGKLRTGWGFKSFFTQGAGKDMRSFPLTVTVSRDGYTDEIKVAVYIRGDANDTGVEGRSRRYIAGRKVGSHIASDTNARITLPGGIISGSYTLSGPDADAFSVSGRQLVPRYNLEFLPTHYEVIVEARQVDQFTGVTVEESTIYIYYTKDSVQGTSTTISGATRGEDIGVAVENSAPEFTEGDTATRAVAENTPSGEKIGDPVSATDADEDTLRYSLGGTDAKRFRIGKNTGQLRTRRKLDYETQDSYSVTITASDGNGGKATINVTINVTDVNEDAVKAPAVGVHATETALLANYPNPFNPETWLPYQLAAPADVTLTIYDMSGGVVRRLALGHQAAGVYYSRSRAAYWDGKNEAGEKVATGVYFYTLTAGEFTATRKMLIRK